MNYLRNQSAKIVWNGESGEYFALDKGVRQGGILLPFLLKLYIDGIMKKVDEMGLGCMLSPVRINILAYADDLVLVAYSVSALNELYAKLSNMLGLRKLMINIKKSKCMIFCKKNQTNIQDDIILENDKFEVVLQYKYLGHILQNKLTDDLDIEYRLNIFYAKFNWLFRNFKDISLETFLFLFNAYCMSDYGLSLWNSMSVFSKQFFKTFDVAYSNALKKMKGVPFYTSSHLIANEQNQLLLKHLVTYAQARYFKRIFNTSNILLKILSVFLKDGYLYKSLSQRLCNIYEVDFFLNSTCILKARIYWVQRHEPVTGRLIDV